MEPVIVSTASQRSTTQGSSSSVSLTIGSLNPRSQQVASSFTRSTATLTIPTQLSTSPQGNASITTSQGTIDVSLVTLSPLLKELGSSLFSGDGTPRVVSIPLHLQVNGGRLFISLTTGQPSNPATASVANPLGSPNPSSPAPTVDVSRHGIGATRGYTPVVSVATTNALANLVGTTIRGVVTQDLSATSPSSQTPPTHTQNPSLDALLRPLTSASSPITLGSASPRGVNAGSAAGNIGTTLTAPSPSVGASPSPITSGIGSLQHASSLAGSAHSSSATHAPLTSPTTPSAATAATAAGAGLGASGTVKPHTPLLATSPSLGSAQPALSPQPSIAPSSGTLSLAPSHLAPSNLSGQPLADSSLPLGSVVLIRVVGVASVASASVQTPDGQQGQHGQSTASQTLGGGTGGVGTSASGGTTIQSVGTTPLGAVASSRTNATPSSSPAASPPVPNTQESVTADLVGLGRTAGFSKLGTSGLYNTASSESVARGYGDETSLVRSPWGVLRVQGTIPRGAVLQSEITLERPGSPSMSQPTTISNAQVGQRIATEDATIRMLYALQQQGAGHVAQHILPALNGSMALAMALFFNAIRSGSPERWMERHLNVAGVTESSSRTRTGSTGASASSALATKRPEQSATVDHANHDPVEAIRLLFDTAKGSSAKDPRDPWHTVHIPMAVDGAVRTVAWGWIPPSTQEPNTSSSSLQRPPVRFRVETHMRQTGALRFEGLLDATKFQLVLETALPLSPTLQSDISTRFVALSEALGLQPYISMHTMSPSLPGSSKTPER